jgi:hypothetical protein
MCRYTIELSKNSKRFLDKSDKVTRKRIIDAIHALTENPDSSTGILN